MIKIKKIMCFALIMLCLPITIYAKEQPCVFFAPQSMNEDNEIESITFVGLCTDICVISNALLVKASLPEIPIIVDAKCCAGVTPESHENALKAMEACQIQIDR